MYSHLRHHSSRLMIVILVLTAVALMVSCAPPIPATPAAPAASMPAPIKLTVVELPYMSMAPIFIARAEGYFIEQGLDINYVPLQRSSEAIAALASGDVDVYPGSINVGLLQAMRSEDIRAVAGRGAYGSQDCVEFAILVRKALAEGDALADPHTLAGDRLGTPGSASVREYTTTGLLATVGLQESDFTLTDVADAVAAEALANNAVDVWAGAEPALSRTLADGHSTMWLSWDSTMPTFDYGLLAYGHRLLRQEPDAGRRYMVAYLEGLQQYNQGKTERNISILSEATGLDTDLVRQMCWPRISVDGSYNLQSLHDFQTWAIAAGYMDEPALGDDQFWDGSFLAEAISAAGDAQP